MRACVCMCMCVCLFVCACMRVCGRVCVCVLRGGIGGLIDLSGWKHFLLEQDDEYFHQLSWTHYWYHDTVIKACNMVNFIMSHERYLILP